MLAYLVAMACQTWIVGSHQYSLEPRARRPIRLRKPSVDLCNRSRFRGCQHLQGRTELLVPNQRFQFYEGKGLMKCELLLIQLLWV